MVFAAKPARVKLAEDAGCLLLIFIFRLGQALAAKIVAGKTLFFHVVINGRDRFLDDISVDALGLEVIDHAPAPEFFVVAAIRRKGGAYLASFR
jgi:hypothetical protein